MLPRTHPPTHTTYIHTHTHTTHPTYTHTRAQTLVLMTLPGTYVGAYVAPLLFSWLGSQRILLFYGLFLATSGSLMLGLVRVRVC